MTNDVTITPVMETDEVIGLTASKHYDGDAHKLSVRDINQHVGALLVTLGASLASQDVYEYDGVEEAVFEAGVISITANLFVP